MATQTITASGAGTFVVPSPVTSLIIEAWGAGGGGGGSSSSLAAGGGGGGYSRATISVTPGQTIFYTVGAGGSGATTQGNPGGVSWVNPSANSQPSSNGVVAAGGSAGDNNPNLGGAGSVGTVNFTGGSGQIAGAPGIGGGGGGGAGSAGNGGNGVVAGAGGAGGTPDGGAGGTGVATAPAGAGTAPGGGGGGTDGSGSGANGANGQVQFTWSGGPLVSTTLTNESAKSFSRRDYAEWLDRVINERSAEHEELEGFIREAEAERNLSDTERADRDYNSAEEEYGQSEEALFKNLTTTNHLKFSEAKERRDKARKQRDHNYFMDVVKKAWDEYNKKTKK